jgi:hypothetical protein
MAICREIGRRLTATVPRMLATILNGTIVAGMVVLLHRYRTAPLIPCRVLKHLGREGYFLAPVDGRFTEGFCDCRHAPMREFLLRTLSSPSDALISGHWRTTGDAKRDALVRFVRKLVQSGHRSDEDFVAIKAAGYNDARLAEISLAFATAVFSGFNRINDTEIDFNSALVLSSRGTKPQPPRTRRRRMQIGTRLGADADKSSHVPPSGGTYAASKLVRSRLRAFDSAAQARSICNGSRELVFVAHPKSGEIQGICREIRCGSRLGDDSRQIC